MSYEQNMADADRALWESVQRGDLAGAKAALEAGANPNLVSFFGKSTQTTTRLCFITPAGCAITISWRCC